MFAVMSDSQLGMDGFQVTFKNGFLVSVQFGRFSYAEFNESNIPIRAEVAVIKASSREFVKLGKYDDVLGWQTPERVTSIMHWVSCLPADISVEKAEKICQWAVTPSE